ncbi:hypothetical protein ACPVPU_01970 [Sphingomonas sp. CJ99]
MARHPLSPGLAIALLLPLAGCATTGGDYPSLLPRPVEQGGVARPRPADPAEPAVPAADPAIDSELARINPAFAEALAAFDSAQGDAERAVAAARGSAAGSDRWLTAQLAIGQLDLRRDTLSGLVVDLERLDGDRGISGAAPYPALAARLAEARQALADRRALIARLEQQLAPAG